MFYVEWLRVRNCLKILAIVLGAIFVLAVIVRLFMPTNLNQGHYIDYEMNASGAHAATVHLKNGATRTTILDSEGDRVVIVDRGWHGKHVTVSGPNVNVDRPAHVQIGSVGVHAAPGTNGGHVSVNTDLPIPLAALLVEPGIVGIIIATILGGVLGKENRNHLEIAWTKPVGRDTMALGMFAVDAAGIVGAMLLAFVLEVAGIALFELPHIMLDSRSIAVLGLAAFGVLAFYALCNAASASARGGGGLKALVWLAAIFVPPLSAAAMVPVLIFKIVGNLFGALSLLDPLAYLNTHVDNSGQVGSGAIPGVLGYDVLSSPMWERALILLLLVLVYCAASVVQWRRLEA
jgi:hypothetical protein